MIDNITTNANLSDYTVGDMLSLDTGAIKTLAIQFVAQQVVVRAEMLRDRAGTDGEGVISYCDAAAHLRDAKHSIDDYINGVLADIRSEIIQKVRVTTIIINSMTFTAEGFKSVDATITC